MAFETQSDTAADAATIGKPAASRRDGLRLLIALSVVVAIFQGVEGLNADTSWLLTVDDRWLDGARLYRDILDANPPIWLLMVMPGLLLGRISDIQAEPILVVGIVALALGSVEWTVRTLAARRSHDA